MEVQATRVARSHVGAVFVAVVPPPLPHRSGYWWIPCCRLPFVTHYPTQRHPHRILNCSTLSYEDQCFTLQPCSETHSGCLHDEKFCMQPHPFHAATDCPPPTNETKPVHVLMMMWLACVLRVKRSKLLQRQGHLLSQPNVPTFNKDFNDNKGGSVEGTLGGTWMVRCTGEGVSAWLLLELRGASRKTKRPSCQANWAFYLS